MSAFRPWQHKTANTIPRPPVHKVVAAQCAIAILMSLLGWLFGQTIALSLLLGCLAHVIPHTYFAIRAFRYTGARQTRNVVRASYQGMAGKLVLTACIFAVTFKLWLDVSVWALFAGFIGMQIVTGWLNTILINRPRTR